MMIPWFYFPVKMPPLSVNVLSLADHLKIEWNRSLQDKPCHCQVKFVKVRPCVVNQRLKKTEENKYFSKAAL